MIVISLEMSDEPFSLLVFDSTPKNKRVFADKTLIGRKYAKYERLL